jgi:hypothetical protein
MKRGGQHVSGLRTPAIVGAMVFCIALLANAPASLIGVFSGRGALSYSNAVGTIWSGELSDVSVSGIVLGEVKFRLSPLSLIQLSPQVQLNARGGAVVGHGRITRGFAGTFRLDDVEANASLRGIAPRGVFGEPANGQVKINISRLVFSRRAGCKEASGHLWTDVLNAPAQRFNLPSLPLSGRFECDGEALIVALEGENARTGAALSLRIDKSMTYEIIATARTMEEDVASALRVFGFEDDNGGLTYGSAGVLMGAGS